MTHHWFPVIFDLLGGIRFSQEEGQPIVVEADGTPMMYFVSGCPSMALCNVVQALDLTDGDQPKQIWNYVKTTDRDESPFRAPAATPSTAATNFVVNNSQCCQRIESVETQIVSIV